MTFWMCSRCGYQEEKETTPEFCPSCKRECAFIDVSCYTPECGGEGKVDVKLAGSFKLKGDIDKD